MSRNIMSHHKVIPCLTYASGTADVNGTIIDMQGFESVAFCITAHAVAAGAVTSIKVQQDTAAGGGTMADLLGTSISIADDDDGQVFIVEIHKPRERYLRVVVDKDTSNAVAASGLAILGGTRKPDAARGTVTDSATTEIHASPAEGTA